MGESEEKGAMQAENPFAMLQVHTQSCGMKSDSSGKSPLLKASRACQEGAAATASAVKSRCKATIRMGMDCRGQI